MRALSSIIVFGAVVVAGCGGADSPPASAPTGPDAAAQKADVEDYCNSEERSGAKGDKDAKSKTASAWMSKQVRTEWFKQEMTKTQSGSLDTLQKDAMLRGDFADRGVTNCPTLDNRDPNRM